MLKETPLTIGIEEEYQIIDPKTRELTSYIQQFLNRGQVLGDQLKAEFMQSQVEVGTRICHSVKEAREEVRRLRSAMIEIADSAGLQLAAASTHPFSQWSDQVITASDRYLEFAEDMQHVVRNLLIFGMHVHVGIDDDELRIDLMNQMSYFLPHLLALSCSSPFWEGRDTGLKSYRLTVFDSLPRTGLPERFASYAEYERHVRILMNAGLIEDATRIWWDLRPSARYPTLETRVMDVCTRLEDTISLAALLVCIMRMLYRLRVSNQRWRLYTPMLIRENRWRAMRYSFDEGLIDLGKGGVVAFESLLDEILSLVADDAKALGCVDEVGRTRDILTRGTSAHRQLKRFELEQADGKEEKACLQGVVDMLIADTAEGV